MFPIAIELGLSNIIDNHVPDFFAAMLWTALQKKDLAIHEDDLAVNAPVTS